MPTVQRVQSRCSRSKTPRRRSPFEVWLALGLDDLTCEKHRSVRVTNEEQERSVHGEADARLSSCFVTPLRPACVKSVAICCNLQPMQTDNSARERQCQRRPSRSRAEWLAEARSWRRTGQSAKEYAAARGLNAGTLVVWASKLKVSARSRAPKATGAAKSGPPKFLPVRVIEPALFSADPQRAREDLPVGSARSDARLTEGEAGGDIEIVLLNGRKVRIAAAVDEVMLARVLKVAEGGVSC